MASPPGERAPAPDSARALALAPALASGAGAGAQMETFPVTAPPRGSEGPVLGAAAAQGGREKEERGASSGEGEAEEGVGHDAEGIGDGVGGSGKSGDEDEEEENLPLGGEDYQQGSIARPGDLPPHATGPGGGHAPVLGPGATPSAGASAVMDAAALAGAGTLEMLPAALAVVGMPAVMSSSGSLLKAAKRKKDKEGILNSGSGSNTTSNSHHTQGHHAEGQSTSAAPPSHLVHLGSAPGEDVKGTEALGAARMPVKKVVGSSKTKVVSGGSQGLRQANAPLALRHALPGGRQPWPPHDLLPYNLLSHC